MSCQAFCSFSVTFAALCFHTVGVTMQQRFIPLPRGASELLVPSKTIGCDLNKHGVLFCKPFTTRLGNCGVVQ